LFVRTNWNRRSSDDELLELIQGVYSPIIYLSHILEQKPSNIIEFIEHRIRGGNDPPGLSEKERGQGKLEHSNPTLTQIQ
jgi:hypothetical protein